MTLSERAEEGPRGAGVHAGRVQRHLHGRDVQLPRFGGELDKLNAQVLGITVDTFFALGAGARPNKLNVAAAERLQQGSHRAYGVVNPDMIGLKDIAKRAIFVIDQSGIVRHKEVLEDARNEPDYGKVKQALACL